MAKRTNLVGDVSARLLDLAAYWVQTPSDYDVLMAKVLNTSWALDHMPVLSMRGHSSERFTTYTTGKPPAPVPITSIPGQDDHILFTKFEFGQPGGKLVLCPGRCEAKMDPKQTKGGVRCVCEGTECEYKCTIPQFKTDQTTRLGRRGLVAIKYPPEIFHAQWTWGGGDNPRPTLPLPPPPTPSPQPSAPPPSHEIKPLPTARLPHLEAMTRSISLPPSRTITPMPSSSPLVIRIPRMSSTQSLSSAGPSMTRRTRSATATPPLEASQESSESKKRTFADLTGAIWPKRQRSEKDKE